jgi:hypothetical protein
VAKALGAEWKAMSAEDKAPFEERARQDKVGGGGKGTRGDEGLGGGVCGEGGAASWETAA